MADESPRPYEFREQILRDVFEQLDFDEGVHLVGILFEYRIVFSRTFSTLIRDQTVRLTLDPLEPQESSALVGSLFGFDCDDLFVAFERKWGRLKCGPRVQEFVARIRSHQYVEQVEKWTAVP
jgi:hypothetical protein